MISEKPFTKEEFERFMVGVRARFEQKRREQRAERAAMAVAGVMFTVAIAFIVFA